MAYSPDQCVSPIDILLMFCGNKLYTCNKLMKLANVMQYGINVIHFGINLYLVSTDSQSRDILFFVLQLSYLLLALITLHTIKWKCNDIISLNRTIVGNVSNHMQFRLILCSTTLAVAAILPQVSMTYFFLKQLYAMTSTEVVRYYFNDSQTYYNVKLAYAWYDNFCYTIIPYALSGQALYLYFIYGQHLVQKTFFGNIMGRKVNVFGEKQSLEILNNLRSIDNLKASIEEIFNLMPFLWFVYIFVSCSGYIKLLTGSHQTLYYTKEYTLTEVFYLAWFMMYQVIIIMCIQHSNDYSVSSLDTFITSLISSPLNQSNLFLIKRLKANSGTQLTGWNMFELNKKFILDFLGALISFTVLFIQLSNF